jgi:hypothetical protein
MLLPSCSEIPDVGSFYFYLFSFLRREKIACSPAIETIKLVWPEEKIKTYACVPGTKWTALNLSQMNKATAVQQIT